MIDRDRTLYYRAGYKYQTSRDYRIKTGIIPNLPVSTDFLQLGLDGTLWIRKGYAWDGASGPTWDTNNSMIGSLVHDVFYQLIRLGHVHERYKIAADRLLRDICVEDGMWQIRANYWQWAVVKFGLGSTKPSHEPSELRAP